MRKNNEIMNEWGIIREKGMKKYVLNKYISLGIMMIIIYFICVVVNKKDNYISNALIYTVIVVVAPIASWFVNEYRYKKSNGKSK